MTAIIIPFPARRPAPPRGNTNCLASAFLIMAPFWAAVLWWASWL